MEKHSPTTPELLARFHDGDADALNTLLEQHLPYVRRRVSETLGDALRRKSDSGDIVQEAVREFLSYAPRFVIASENALRGILIRIAHNVIRDQHDYFTAKRRDMAREKPIPTSTVLDLSGIRSSETPSAVAVREEARARVRLAIELLDPADRDLITMRDWDQLEYSEIASRLDLTVDAARMRYKRALLRLSQTGVALKAGRLDDLLDF